MKKIITFVFLFITAISFAQTKPKDGVYTFKYYDIEYHKFVGKCKVVVKNDSIKVIAIEGCHVAKGTVIDEGVLQKNKGKDRSVHSGDWHINTGNKDDDETTSLDFKKKIYYSF